MKAKIRLQLILFVCAVLLLVLNGESCNARGGTFVIEPKQELITDVNLSVGNGTSSTVVGHLSVTNASIDFWITSPSKVVLLNDSNITNTTFTFDAKENGNYTMHLRNTYLTQNVTVELNYGVNVEVRLTADIGINFGVSSGSIHVVGPPPPQPPDDPPHLDNPYGRYLNFLTASKIIRTIRENLQNTPIRGALATVTCIIVAIGLGIVEQHQPSLKKYGKATPLRKI